jgi:hypothetical protein
MQNVVNSFTQRNTIAKKIRLGNTSVTNQTWSNQNAQLQNLLKGVVTKYVLTNNNKVRTNIQASINNLRSKGNTVVSGQLERYKKVINSLNAKQATNIANLNAAKRALANAKTASQAKNALIATEKALSASKQNEINRISARAVLSASEAANAKAALTAARGTHAEEITRISANRNARIASATAALEQAGTNKAAHNAALVNLRGQLSSKESEATAAAERAEAAETKARQEIANANKRVQTATTAQAVSNAAAAQAKAEKNAAEAQAAANKARATAAEARAAEIDLAAQEKVIAAEQKVAAAVAGTAAAEAAANALKAAQANAIATHKAAIAAKNAEMKTLKSNKAKIRWKLAALNAQRVLNSARAKKNTEVALARVQAAEAKAATAEAGTAAARTAQAAANAARNAAIAASNKEVAAAREAASKAVINAANAQSRANAANQAARSAVAGTAAAEVARAAAEAAKSAAEAAKANAEAQRNEAAKAKTESNKLIEKIKNSARRKKGQIKNLQRRYNQSTSNLALQIKNKNKILQNKRKIEAQSASSQAELLLARGQIERQQKLVEKIKNNARRSKTVHKQKAANLAAQIASRNAANAEREKEITELRTQVVEGHANKEELQRRINANRAASSLALKQSEEAYLKAVSNATVARAAARATANESKQREAQIAQLTANAAKAAQNLALKEKQIANAQTWTGIAATALFKARNNSRKLLGTALQKVNAGVQAGASATSIPATGGNNRKTALFKQVNKGLPGLSGSSLPPRIGTEAFFARIAKYAKGNYGGSMKYKSIRNSVVSNANKLGVSSNQRVKNALAQLNKNIAVQPSNISKIIAKIKSKSFQNSIETNDQINAVRRELNTFAPNKTAPGVVNAHRILDSLMVKNFKRKQEAAAAFIRNENKFPGYSGNREKKQIKSSDPKFKSIGKRLLNAEWKLYQATAQTNKNKIISLKNYEKVKKEWDALGYQKPLSVFNRPKVRTKNNKNGTGFIHWMTKNRKLIPDRATKYYVSKSGVGYVDINGKSFPISNYNTSATKYIVNTKQSRTQAMNSTSRIFRNIQAKKIR